VPASPDAGELGDAAESGDVCAPVVGDVPGSLDAVSGNIATPARFGLGSGAWAGVAGAEACTVYGIPLYEGQIQLPFTQTHNQYHSPSKNNRPNRRPSDRRHVH
jgi:hypothetical protein